jgi:hypothetical protein
VVGGAVSLLTTLIVEHRRTVAARADKRRADYASALVAARLLQLELRDIESALTVALEHQPFRWPLEGGVPLLPTAVWQAHAAQLAVILDPGPWDQVATPYSVFEYINLYPKQLTHKTASTALAQATEALRVVGRWASGEERLGG